MTYNPNDHPHTEFLQEIESRQSNILWPDAMHNSRGVDELLWKGSSKATKVQRVGIAIFGLLFLSIGADFVLEAAYNASKLQTIFGVVFFLIGIKVLFNAFRRSTKS